MTQLQNQDWQLCNLQLQIALLRHSVPTTIWGPMEWSAAGNKTGIGELRGNIGLYRDYMKVIEEIRVFTIQGLLSPLRTVFC